MYGAVGVLAAGVVLWAVRPAQFGDVDPVGAVIGLVSLAVAVPGTVLAVRARRWQETSTTDLTQRLAQLINSAEGKARQQFLGGHNKPIDVTFRFTPSPAHNAGRPSNKGRLQEVVDYYIRLQPRRMVITGAPGAGKTVLAVELILALLQARQPDDPVPVRLSAASWTVADEPGDPQAVADAVEGWLVSRRVNPSGVHAAWRGRAS